MEETSTLIEGTELMVLSGLRILIPLSALTLLPVVTTYPNHPISTTTKSRIFHGSRVQEWGFLMNPIATIFRSISIVQIMIRTISAISWQLCYGLLGSSMARNTQLTAITTRMNLSNHGLSTILMIFSLNGLVTVRQHSAVVAQFLVDCVSVRVLGISSLKSSCPLIYM